MRQNILYLIIPFVFLISCASVPPEPNLHKALPEIRQKKIAVYSCDFIEDVIRHPDGTQSLRPKRAYFAFNTELTAFFVNGLKLKKYSVVDHLPILPELKHFEFPVSKIEKGDYYDTLSVAFVEKIIEYGKMCSADVVLYFRNYPGKYAAVIKVFAYDTSNGNKLGWPWSTAGGWFSSTSYGGNSVITTYSLYSASTEQREALKDMLLSQF